VNSLEQLYKQKHLKQVWVACALGILLVGLLMLSLISGSGRIYWDDFARLVALGSEHETFRMIVLEVRLPRALAGILVGMLLALSGVIMQGALRNPLASPFTLGVSQAAGFGASVAIVLVSPMVLAFPWIGIFGTALSAFIASMACVLLIIWMGKKSGMSSTSIILSGVAFGSLFHAGTMLLQYITNESNAAATLFWTFGDLSKATYPALGVLFVALAVVFPVVWVAHWKFDALAFGDVSAFNKGIAIKPFRTTTLLLASFCTALAVAFFGIIGFIGLIAPHLARLLLGASHGALIPLATLFGGVLLLGADLFARLLFYPSSLPVGIITAFIGSPLLLYLLGSIKGRA